MLDNKSLSSLACLAILPFCLSCYMYVEICIDIFLSICLYLCVCARMCMFIIVCVHIHAYCTHFFSLMKKERGCHH